MIVWSVCVCNSDKSQRAYSCLESVTVKEVSPRAELLAAKGRAWAAHTQHCTQRVSQSVLCQADILCQLQTRIIQQYTTTLHHITTTQEIVSISEIKIVL